MIREELTLDQLKTRLARLLPSVSPFAGTVYRSSIPRYANESDLLTGEGSKRYGGRWNPIGISPVYASLTPETAMAETLAHNRYYGVPIEEAMPRTFVAMEARLQSVLDLRDGSIRRRLQISQHRILTTDWRKEVHRGHEPITQLIGHAASEVGLEGMIVPSAAEPNGCNLVAFTKNLQLGSVLRVLHSGDLSF